MAYIKAALIAALKVIFKRGGRLVILRDCDFSHCMQSKEEI